MYVSAKPLNGWNLPAIARELYWILSLNKTAMPADYEELTLRLRAWSKKVPGRRASKRESGGVGARDVQYRPMGRSQSSPLAPGKELPLSTRMKMELTRSRPGAVLSPYRRWKRSKGMNARLHSSPAKKECW